MLTYQAEKNLLFTADSLVMNQLFSQNWYCCGEMMWWYTILVPWNRTGSVPPFTVSKLLNPPGQGFVQLHSWPWFRTALCTRPIIQTVVLWFTTMYKALTRATHENAVFPHWLQVTLVQGSQFNSWYRSKTKQTSLFSLHYCIWLVEECGWQGSHGQFKSG